MVVARKNDTRSAPNMDKLFESREYDNVTKIFFKHNRCSAWNSLFVGIRMSDSIYSFKSKMYKYLREMLKQLERRHVIVVLLVIT